MRVGYLLPAIVFAVFNSVGCKHATVEQPVRLSATAAPVIQKDEKGNSINPDGWILPVTTAIEKENLTRIERYQDGGIVKVSVVSHSLDLDPDHRVIVSGPYSPGGQASVITHVDELSVKDGKVFCFIYTFSPFTDKGRGEQMTVVVKSRFCDMDGDGKYELQSDDFATPVVVPNWAR